MAPSRDELLASLRAQMAAIERGEGSGAISVPATTEPATEEPGEAFAEGPEKVGVARGSVYASGSDPEAAFQRIVRLTSLNEQATAKLRDRLSREGFPASAIDEALERAVRCGLVDDRRYAEVLVRSRISQGRGRAGIELELRQLGIEYDDIDAVFAECNLSEVERAYAVLLGKPPRSKDPRGSGYARLLRKGYSSEVASKASRMWCERFVETCED